MEAICTNFMMVFGVNRSGRNPQPTTWEADTLTNIAFPTRQKLKEDLYGKGM